MRGLRGWLPLAVLLVSPPAAAERGPIWSKSLPVTQTSLLAPYAAYHFGLGPVNALRANHYRTRFARAARGLDGGVGPLGLHPGRRVPSAEHSLPFYNNGKDMAEVATSEYGFCLGFTFVVRRFNVLADFAPEAPPLARVEDYFPIVDRIMGGSPETIPGYRNLFEFASEPRIARRLKTHVADQWALRNVSADGLEIYAKGLRPLTGAQARRLRKEVEAKLALGVNPIVSFTLSADFRERVTRAVVKKLCDAKPEACEAVKKEIAKEEPKGIRKLIDRHGGIHVVQVFEQVFETEAVDERAFRLRVWDINVPAEKAATTITISAKTGGAKTVVRLVADGLELEVPVGVTDVSVHAQDSADLGMMLEGLRKACAKRECRRD